MKRNSLLALVAAAALLPLSPAAGWAGSTEEPPAMGGYRRNPEARLEKQLAELNLTAAQKQKVDAILAQAKSKREAERATMRSEFERMHTLLEADAPDEAAVLAQAQKIGDMKTARHKQMLQTLLAIRAELTPEQRTQLKAKLREQRGKWFHGRHHGAPPDAPPDAD